MSKPATKMLVPKLRFPEFRDAREWEETKLIGMAKRIIQKNKHNQVTRVLTNSAVNGIVDQRDYFDKDIANKNNLGGYFIVDKGDYVYNPRISKAAPVGPISKNKIGKGVMSPLYTVFRFKESNNGFYEQYFKSAHWYQYLRMVSNSGARHDRMSITNDDFEKMPLPSPAPKEQQKIADCLSSLDELITAHSQKHAALKAHKKGLMQQLFPSEGETVPKLRFPEFRDAGEWEENRVKKYFSRVRNGFVGTATPYYVSNGIPYLQGKNIKKGQIDIKGLITISNDFHQKQAKSQLRINDVLMVQSGHVGECALVDQTFAGANCHALIVMTPYKNVCSAFFVYYFYSEEGKREIYRITTGNVIKHVLTSDLKTLKIYAPDFLEQKKIADCLSSIDDLITAQAQKIKSLKAHKKGLMQQLFPATDDDCMEAEGRATQDAKAEVNG